MRSSPASSQAQSGRFWTPLLMGRTALRQRSSNKGEVVKPKLVGNLEGLHGRTRLEQASGCLIRSKR